jgi:hypothetical protein
MGTSHSWNGHDVCCMLWWGDGRPPSKLQPFFVAPDLVCLTCQYFSLSKTCRRRKRSVQVLTVFCHIIWSVCRTHICSFYWVYRWDGWWCMNLWGCQNNHCGQWLRWSRGSMLAFGTQVHRFTPGRSLRIFRAKKSSARVPLEGK